MTARNVAHWLPNLLGPVVLQSEGTALTARGTMNFIGFAVTDNAEDDRIDFDASEISYLRGVPVLDTEPTTGQVLTFDGTSWGPDDAAGGGVPTGTGAYLVSGGAMVAAAGTINLASSTYVTGILPIANGGIGLSAVGSANTVLKSNGTAWAAAQIVDAYIDAAAAIATSKIAFAASTLALTTGALTLTTGYISLGATPATSSDLRVAATFALRHRNAANNGNWNVISVDGANAVVVGEPSASASVSLYSASAVNLYIGSNGLKLESAQARWSVVHRGDTSTNDPLRFGRSAVTHDDSASLTLTNAQYKNLVVDVSGALTADRNVILPTTDEYAKLVRNSTTGGFALTFKTSAGTGVVVRPGHTALVVCDGTNIWGSPLAVPESVTATKTANYTATIADDVVPCDTTAGAFTLTLPANPVGGHKIIVKDVGGVFAASAVTVGRNGKTIETVAADWTLSSNRSSTVFQYNANTSDWMIV